MTQKSPPKPAAPLSRGRSLSRSVVPTPIAYEGLPAGPADFGAAGLQATILDSQRHGQPYREFKCRRISQNVSPASVTSPFVALAMPTHGGFRRARQWAVTQAFADCESKNRDEVRDRRFALPRQQLFG
jgi:hypothetical protein